MIQMFQRANRMKAISSGRTVRLFSQRARLFSNPQISQSFPQGGINNHFHFKQAQIVPRCQHPSKVISNRAFSTDSNGATTPDLTIMSEMQLKKLALKYSRQDNPAQAHLILDQLQLEAGSSSETLSELRTSIIDSWITHQNKCCIQLKESVANRDSLRVQEGHLEEICRAAERAFEIIIVEESPSTHHFVAVLKAWANACEASKESNLVKLDFVRGIPQRAQHLLDLQDNPSVESYNQVLKAWAYSREHLRGTMAEQLFHKISEPDGESYKIMIRAWCWSKERRCAFTATGHFMRMMRLLEIDRPDMEPSMADYHILFRAWTSAEDKNAPSKVQTVLQIIDNSHQKGLTKNQADESCYRDALITMSRRVNVPEVGELADATLAEMKDAMLFPDTECYGAAILAWKNVATGRECDDRESAVRRTLSLLQEMTKAYHRTTTVTVKPTTKHYNHVLEALTISRSPKATNNAEMLLTALEEAATNNNDENWQEASISPNAESYRLVLEVWKNSKSANKVPHALNILQRIMKRNDLTIEGSSSQLSYVEVFGAFIDVCASCLAKQDSRKLMTLALRTVEDMKSLGLHPDSTTYTALLGACHNLIPDGKERQKILGNIFSKACKEGYVDQNLLEQFKHTASTYLFSKAVVSYSREVEKMKVVPESWTRQAKGFQANIKGGRQILPLSIEGKFTFTKAAAEYKMRKLRRRRNQLTLQGGRMK